MPRAILSTLALVGILLSGCARQPPPPRGDETPADKSIAIVLVGDVDEGLAERVRAFVSRQLGVALLMKPPRKHLSGTLEEQLSALTPLISETDLCLLALSDADHDVESHGIIHRALRIGIVNTKALRPSPIEAAEARERYGRRAEKESMRAIGHLLGIKTCPMPMCALCDYRTDEQLDAKGRNFCPPCQEKMRRALSHAGAKVKEQSYQ